MKTAEQKAAWRRFWLINAAVLGGGGLCYTAILWMSTLHPAFSVCLVHDTLSLYCPSCGATRATWALLHGDLLAALRLHGGAVAVYLSLAALDIIAFCRLCRGSTRPFYVKPTFWWGLFAVFVGYAVLRDVCLATFQWDWTGDFIK